uniref:DNA replication complex GINS family protein n=1 Tax=Ignisphaera aggregans TaxID=334771 RepID=A0A7J3YU49_9CREN
MEFDILNLMYALSPVKVMVLKSTPYIPTLRASLQKGSEERIPRLYAQILEELGYVEILDKLPSPQELTKLRFSHIQQRSSLMKLDDYFYISVSGMVTKLEEKAKKETDIMLLKVVERAKEDFSEVYNIRISNIFRAIQFRSLDTISKFLTLEERTLATLLYQLLESWLRRYTLVR